MDLCAVWKCLFNAASPVEERYRRSFIPSASSLFNSATFNLTQHCADAASHHNITRLFSASTPSVKRVQCYMFYCDYIFLWCKSAADIVFYYSFLTHVQFKISHCEIEPFFRRQYFIFALGYNAHSLCSWFYLLLSISFFYLFSFFFLLSWSFLKWKQMLQFFSVASAHFSDHPSQSQIAERTSNSSAQLITCSKSSLKGKHLCY